MSRIGKMPIHLPKGVEVKISDDNVLTVKGPLGELTQPVNPIIKMHLEDNTLTFQDRPGSHRRRLQSAGQRQRDGNGSGLFPQDFLPAGSRNQGRDRYGER